MERYFVMIHAQEGERVLPLLDASAEGEVAMFHSVSEAMEAAEGNDLCVACGWDVFMKGGGIDGGDAL